MQLYSLSIFRAVAIVLVVLSHAPALGALKIDTFHEVAFWNFVSGATTLFVFISGFLFHHVFLKRFAFASFFTKKLLNLGIPYVVLTFAALAIGCQQPAIVQGEGVLRQVSLGAFMLGTGHGAVSYWYIPFVITLFAMAPLHVRFTALSVRWQMATLVVLLAIALLVHRPPQNIGALQNLIYYTPVYLVGVFCSQHRDAVYPVISRWMWLLLAAVLGLAAFQAAIGEYGNYVKPMLEFRGIDLLLVQKLCLALFLLSFLRRFEAKRSRIIDIVADTSFATFFLHPLFIEVFIDSPFTAPLLAQESWVAYFVVSGLCVATCAAGALWVRRLFGAQSRLLTGY